MNGLKCGRCSLVNIASDMTCRRCGRFLAENISHSSPPISPREAAKRSSWFYTIVVVLLLSALATYVYFGVQKSYEQIGTGEPNRPGNHVNQQPAGLSRSDYDQRRVEPYKNAIQNSPGLAAGQSHTAETQKLMEQSQATPQPQQARR